jgi:hypothetical protein
MGEIMKVLILSMGKAGSTTVINALKSAGMEYGRLHWHNRNEINPVEYSHFIAMAREPVARAISDYFESGLDIQIGIAQTLAFFNEVVRQVTGVDALSTRQIIGSYKITAAPVGMLLTIRTEDMTDGLARGLGDLLAKKPDTFTVTHHPKGSERFGIEYEKFKAEFKLPRSYLKKVAYHSYCLRFNYQEAVMRWSE